MKYYSFTCEWDIGINEQLFSTPEIARAHIAKAMLDSGVEDTTIDEAEDEGLVTIEENDMDNIISEMPVGYPLPEVANVAADVVHLTDQDFDNFIAESKVPVLVDFWAPWCGPCKMLSPLLDELAAEQAGQLFVVKINCDTNTEIPKRFGVRGIPTMVIIKDGQVMKQQVGSTSKQALDKLVAPYL